VSLAYYFKHPQLTSLESVVFSYWTYTLDLVGALLKEAGIQYTRIDGQRSGGKRDEANEKFQNDKSVLVILVSITCGGAGYVTFFLNLRNLQLTQIL
jgi:SNF2 family DNA or RNA helicase